LQDAGTAKKLMRLKMDALRRELSAEERSAASGRICAFAEALCESRLAGDLSLAIGVYIPFRGEVDLRPLMRWAWRRGIRVAVPRTDRQERTMSLHPIAGFGDLAPGNWGIAEPKPGIPALEPREIGIIFVPGLAFDMSGGRLGYGGGFYDRFFRSLENAGARPLKIGAAYHIQLVERVPAEPHDARVDLIVTERGMHEARPDCS